MCQYNTRTEERAEKNMKKKGKKNPSVLLFVFSLVYLVWGSLVYNTYHRVSNYLFEELAEREKK